MGLHIDFDQPTYLRAVHGLAVVSRRLDHLLPEASSEAPEPQAQPSDKSEKVVINRVFNPLRLTTESPSEPKPPAPDVQEPAPADPEPDDAVDFDSEEPETVLDQETDQPDTKAEEISFRGGEGKSVTGRYAGSAFAPYRFNKGNSKSFYLRLDKSLIWGIDLRSALVKSKAQKGDTIQVTYLGKTPVKVLVKIKKGTQSEKVWETRHRNQWDIKVLTA